MRRRRRGAGVRLEERLGGRKPSEARIGIVGSGASGVAVARELRRLGYHQVALLEQGDRVGGKCWTFEHEGKTYEVGAGALTHRYRRVRAWMREAGIRAAPKYSGLFVDLESGGGTFKPPAFADGAWARAPLHLAKVYRELARYRGIDDPGLDGMPANLFRPASEFIRDAGIEVAAGFGEPFFTGFGYGRYDEMPALYFLKYATVFGPIFEILPDGYGGLVRAAARGLDVRLGTSVERIERSDASVRVHVASGDALDFDALVLACPLDTAADFLDVSARERALFSRIRHHPYYVLGARVRGLPSARYTFFPRHFRAEHEGDPVFIYRRWGEPGLAFFYGYHAGGDEDRTEERVATTAERLGGRIDEVVMTQHWRYFPHVGREDLEDGFYDKLEALQGERCTYYAGETLAFGTVEMCVRYGEDLARRFFAPAR